MRVKQGTEQSPSHGKGRLQHLGKTRCKRTPESRLEPKTKPSIPSWRGPRCTEAETLTNLQDEPRGGRTTTRTHEHGIPQEQRLRHQTQGVLGTTCFRTTTGGPPSDIYKGRISAHRGRLPHAGTVRHYVREKSGFLRDWPRGLQNVRFHGAK